MLLEPIANTLLRSHPLHHAAVDTSVLLGRHSLGSEVVDARGEAVLYKAAECLRGLAWSVVGPKRRTYAHEFLDLALLHALL